MGHCMLMLPLLCVSVCVCARVKGGLLSTDGLALHLILWRSLHQIGIAT